MVYGECVINLFDIEMILVDTSCGEFMYEIKIKDVKQNVGTTFFHSSVDVFGSKLSQLYFKYVNLS